MACEKKILAAVASAVLAMGLAPRTASAETTAVYTNPASSLFEQRLAEQQKQRQEYWENVVIDWPDERHVVDESLDGLPGIDYEEGSVAAYLVIDCSPQEAIETLSSLQTAKLPEGEAERIDETFIRHQFTLRLDIYDGYSVQDAIDELFACPVIDYVQPNYLYYADSATRGPEDLEKGYITYRNPEEAEEMTRRWKNGEITKQEWQKYIYDNYIGVYPGKKINLDDGTHGTPGVDYYTDEVVIQIEMDSDPEEVIAALESMESVTLREGHHGRDNITEEGILHDRSVIMDINEGYSIQDAIDELWDCPYVAYVGLNGDYYADEPVIGDPSEGETLDGVTPDATGTSIYEQTTNVNDPDIATNQDWLAAIDVQNAWDINKGQGYVSVAVLDTGFDLNHEDLAAVFDTTHAYNAVTGTQDVSPLSDHGTHVAGIISAEANNGIGIAGVSHNAVIVPMQVFHINNQGKLIASWTDLGAAIDRVVTYATGGDVDNLSVINMSLGGFGNDTAFEYKVQYAYGLGITTVCAAGNFSDDDVAAHYNPATQSMDAFYPSDIAECISVCAVKSSGEHALFSQFNQNKDISAPGFQVYSTMPNDSYGYKSGTSMAAPVVSGVAALLYAQNPTFDVDDIKDILYSTARDLTGTFDAPDNRSTITYGTGWDSVTGWGMVDVSAALEEALDRELASDWERISGANRYNTSACTSSSSFTSAQTVIIASGVNFPDALAAAPLAGLYSAPVLLVPPTGNMPQEISSEISRLGATNAIVVGGTSAVSDAMMAQVEAITGSAQRIAGSTRIGTCLQVATALGSSRSATAVIVNGYSYADALSISSYAYASKSAIFLTKLDGTLDSSEVAAINTMGYQKILIVGGESVVSESIKTALGTVGRSFYRVAGSSRYATNANAALWATGEISNAAIQPEVTLSSDVVYVATGADFPDALGAGAAAGHVGGAVLLAYDSDNGRLPATVYLFANNGMVDEGTIVGGTAVLPTCVARDYMIAAG